MAYELEIMYGIEVCELHEAWKAKGKVHGRFYKKLIEMRNCGFAEM